jgi:HEPN domain-containing protein
MKPDPVEEGRCWFEQSEQDLAAARLLGGAHHHNLACFHAQQAVEKALKAYLFSQGAREVRGHSASVLCEDAAHFDPSFSGLRKTAALVDKYYISTRYPNSVIGGRPREAYDERDTERALEVAGHVLEFVRARLPGG